MKFYIGIIILFCGIITPLSGRVVTFNRKTVGSGLSYPHGDWAGNIDGTSQKYERDLFATIGVGRQAAWYANTNKGATWSVNNIFTSTSPYYNWEIAGTDLDKDGDVDAVSTDDNNTATGLSYLLLHTNTGGGTFTTTDINSAGMSGLFRQIRFGDLNNDGDVDIIVAVNTNRFFTSQTNVGVYWFENNGNMTFTQHLIGFCNAWKVDCFDNDVPADGHLEVVVSEYYHSDLDTMLNCELILYRNNGSEVFTPFILDNSFAPGSQPSNSGGAGVRCADFDKDGLIDIVSGNASAGIFYWYENIGGNSFSRHTIDNNCSCIDGIDICDFEPDGDMDVAVAGRNYWFRWYENDGNGNFIMHTIDTQYQLFDLPYVSYFDGDSCCDIALTEASSSGYVFVYLNPCPGGSVEESSVLEKGWLKVPSVIKKGNVKLSFKISNNADVRLEIRDVTGRLVDLILDKTSCNPGVYTANWNNSGKPNGIYFLILKAGNSSAEKKVILI